MPAVSQKQQEFMGAKLAEERKTGHNETGMSTSQLKDFASTKRKGLPMRKTSVRKPGMGR